MSISTLSQLLRESQSDYLCYDLGRRVQAIHTTEFNAIERQQAPYPYPVQGHACFALIFWPQLSNQEQEPFLWFLKFPLDERGLLEQAAVQEYLTSVITLLGQQVTHALTEEQEQQLQQSPYLFTPAEEKRAALHAQLSLRWQRQPSVHFELAQTALAQPEHWQQVGVQGLHDVAARLAELPTTQTALLEHFDNYPAPLRQATAIALEHQQLPTSLTTALAAKVANLTAGDVRADLLRSLAGSATTEAVQQAVQQVLANASVDECVICCARLWQAFDPLYTPHLKLELLLMALAQHDDKIFAALVTDLLRLPMLRPHLLVTLQRDDLAQPIRQAWQGFIHGATHAK
ncbi:DUF3549 family protein [Pseudidiomarina sp. CB1]|uniref:DUF3549 family protein n=1 Tax=Pseudidiomarina sp. CB1 TaxID=2972484 RepID=UPI0021611E5F|nr:DUF3549 family protein [Pseudidiomarina sp. CB1]